MTGVERFVKALHKEEPDLVPHMEIVIDPKVRNAILPGASYEEFTEYMDLDAYIVLDKLNSWRFETIDEAKKIVKDQWGGLTQFTSEVLGYPIGRAINSEKDLDHYNPPDPDEEWRYENLKQAVRRFKGKRAVVAHVTDVFEIVRDKMISDEAYFMGMIRNPSLIHRIQEIILDYNVRYIKNCMEVGADVLCITGDFAMTNGPFVSPKHTAQFLIPPLKRQIEVAKRFGKPVFKHTDGNIWEIFNLLIDAGIDGINPIDPMAGMDLGEAKKRYGKKVCLMGNVNCGATLSWKSAEEVRQEVKECIRKAGDGGGYVCMSSNTIHSGVKPENYVAMVNAIREFGRYPLDLD